MELVRHACNIVERRGIEMKHHASGKSNLMDAISFVVGLQSKELRGKQLKDLIYRCSSDTGDGTLRLSIADCDDPRG